MAKQSLKVVIAGRTYPLSVSEQEVEKVQTAAEEINQSIKKLQKNYAVKDMQDLLAMTTLQMAVKDTEDTVDVESQSAKKELGSVQGKLQNLLSELENL